MAAIRKTGEAGLPANMWDGLELRLAVRLSATVSVPKVSFLLRFGDEALSEASGPEEVRRVFVRRLKSRGWKVQEVLPPAGDYSFERYVIVEKRLRGKGRG